ncbi:hypothetical protein FOA52_008721 [Chlamydomonas sp. UWO 241]|nr:hypothetical protein FOA52_008721 [Chlamydomonas sp. UWO 241]
MRELGELGAEVCWLGDDERTPPPAGKAPAAAMRPAPPPPLCLLLLVLAACPLCLLPGALAQADGPQNYSPCLIAWEGRSPRTRPIVTVAKNTQYKALLSLDGGDVRATITVAVLCEVESTIKRQLIALGRVSYTNIDQFDILLSDYFDVIAGTSAGSYLSTYIGTSGGNVNAMRNVGVTTTLPGSSYGAFQFMKAFQAMIADATATVPGGSSEYTVVGPWLYNYFDNWFSALYNNISTLYGHNTKKASMLWTWTRASAGGGVTAMSMFKHNQAEKGGLFFSNLDGTTETVTDRDYYVWQWREPTGDAAGHALFSPTDAARWLVDGLARVRDALPGMRTVTDLCVLWAWLAAVDMAGERAAVVEILQLVGWKLPSVITPAGWQRLRGAARLEAAVPTLWRMPLLNARKEPIWRLWARFAADRGQMITIVSAYSPTEAASDEEAGDFYLRVAALADKANDKRDLLIVAGGSQRRAWDSSQLRRPAVRREFNLQLSDRFGLLEAVPPEGADAQAEYDAMAGAMHTAWLRSKSAAAKRERNRANRAADAAVQRDRERWISQQVAEAQDMLRKKNLRQFARACDRLAGRSRSHQIPPAMRDVSGALHSGPDGVLKAMTESFDKLYGGETKLSDETLNQLENDVAAFELTRATEVDEAHGRPPDLAETEACGIRGTTSWPPRVPTYIATTTPNSPVKDTYAVIDGAITAMDPTAAAWPWMQVHMQATAKRTAILSIGTGQVMDLSYADKTDADWIGYNLDYNRAWVASLSTRFHSASTFKAVFGTYAEDQYVRIDQDFYTGPDGDDCGGVFVGAECTLVRTAVASTQAVYLPTYTRIGAKWAQVYSAQIDQFVKKFLLDGSD